jgi:hypothetical protein
MSNLNLAQANLQVEPLEAALAPTTVIVIRDSSGHVIIIVIR